MDELLYKIMFSKYPDILSVKDIAEIFGFSTKKIYQLIQEGKIPPIPCGRTIRIAKISVINYVLQHQQ